MLKKLGFGIAIVSIFALQSCTMDTENTYFKNSATSMQTNLSIDKSSSGMMGMLGGENPVKKISGLENISEDWKSLYDIQKNGKLVLNDNDAKPLKKMFLKLNKSNDQVNGLSVKYDKLLPEEIVSLFASKKELNKIPMQDIAKWDGKKLEIDTEKFNIGESISELQKKEAENAKKVPQTKQDSIEAYGNKMLSGMVGMMKIFDLNYTNTLKFQSPIKSIEGKHDFVEKVDDHTIKIKMKTDDLWDSNKTLTNKDKKIVIYTK